MTCTCSGTRDAQAWEYIRVPPGNPGAKDLITLGRQGWEAYAVYNGWVYLKRPKTPKYVVVGNTIGVRLEDNVCHPDNLKEKP